MAIVLGHIYIYTCIIYIYIYVCIYIYIFMYVCSISIYMHSFFFFKEKTILDSEVKEVRSMLGEGLKESKDEGSLIDMIPSWLFARWWFQIFFSFNPTWGRFPF